MIALPTVRGVLNSKGGFDSDYQAILTKANSLGYSLPDVATQIAGNQFILSLKSSGIWNKLDVLWVYATTGDQSFATLNWKNPNLYQATLVSGPTFTPKRGFSGNGVNSYLNLIYNPYINGSQYTQDNASRAIYISTQASAGVATPVLDGNSNTAVNGMRNNRSISHRINSVTNLGTTAELQGGGLKVISRTDANNIVITSGSGAQQIYNVASITMSSAPQFILRSGGGYGTAEIGVYAMGSELTGDQTALNSAIKAYILAMSTTFDSDYQAVLTKAASLGYTVPSAYCQFVQNEIVLKLKSIGTWAKLDLFYMMENDCPDSNFATLNWKNPNNFQLTLVNNPTWVSKRGIQCDGTALQYIDTNWQPLTHGVNWVLDSASVMFRAEDITSGSSGVGCANSGGTTILLCRVDNSVTQRINSSNSWSSTPNSQSGDSMRMFQRSSSTDVLYRQVTAGLAVVAGGARTSTSTAVTNDKVWLGRTGTTYLPFATWRWAMFGASMTDTEAYSTQQVMMGIYGAL